MLDFIIYVSLNLKTIKYYLIELATDFLWQPGSSDTQERLGAQSPLQSNLMLIEVGPEAKHLSGAQL